MDYSERKRPPKSFLFFHVMHWHSFWKIVFRTVQLDSGYAWIKFFEELLTSKKSFQLKQVWDSWPKTKEALLMFNKTLIINAILLFYDKIRKKTILIISSKHFSTLPFSPKTCAMYWVPIRFCLLAAIRSWYYIYQLLELLKLVVSCRTRGCVLWESTTVGRDSSFPVRVVPATGKANSVCTRLAPEFQH